MAMFNWTGQSAAEKQAMLKQYQIEIEKQIYNRSLMGVFYNGLGQTPKTLYGHSLNQAYQNAFLGTDYSTPDPGAAKEAARKAHFAIPAEGIRAGEIIAYRCWQISKSQLWLKSYSADKTWNPGEPMEGDVVQYGVHCFKHLPFADEYCVNQGTPHIIGTIEIWGEIVEHENGYRAQYAALKSLDFLVNCKDDKEAILDGMRQRYKLAA